MYLSLFNDRLVLRVCSVFKPLPRYFDDSLRSTFFEGEGLHQVGRVAARMRVRLKEMGAII